MRNQPIADQIQKGPVEAEIHQEEEGLVHHLKHIVEALLRRRRLGFVRGGPNHTDTDVDASNHAEKTPFQQPRFALVDHDETDAIGNDLGEKLSLDGPKCDYWRKKPPKGHESIKETINGSEEDDEERKGTIGADKLAFREPWKYIASSYLCQSTGRCCRV